MCAFRLCGMFFVIPATVLLTVSFFVLFAIRKVETRNLKTFGLVVAVLLWICAAIVFFAGVYTMSTGKPVMMHSMMSCSGLGSTQQGPMQMQ